MSIFRQKKSNLQKKIKDENTPYYFINFAAICSIWSK